MSAVVKMDEHFPTDIDLEAALKEDTPRAFWDLYAVVHTEAMNAVAEANLTGIDIHGKRYTTVAKRVEILRRFFGCLARLRITEKTETEQGRIAMTAVVELKTPNGWEEVAQGHAEEVRGSSSITRTSAIEVCETSAYGRALANFGLHGGEFASANEVENAISQQGKSFKDNSGRPDTSGVDPAIVSAYADRFTRALQLGDEGNVLIYEDQDKLRTQPELYTAVWDKLSSKQRTDLRKIISERPKSPVPNAQRGFLLLGWAPEQFRMAKK